MFGQASHDVCYAALMGHSGVPIFCEVTAYTTVHVMHVYLNAFVQDTLPHLVYSFHCLVMPGYLVASKTEANLWLAHLDCFAFSWFCMLIGRHLYVKSQPPTTSTDSMHGTVCLTVVMRSTCYH